MTALLDHRTIKRLGLEAVAPRAACSVIEPPHPVPSQTGLACGWRKDPAGRLACTWLPASSRKPARLR
jgi:hypothetical protein